MSMFLISAPACQSSTSQKKTKAEQVQYSLPEGMVAQDAPVGRLKAVINSQQPDVVWLDVRTEKEVKDGYIDGAVIIDFYKEDFQEKVKELDTTKIYYVYCRSGKRSDMTRNYMLRNGFSNVYNVTGGMIAWQKEGYPVKTD